MAKTRLNMSFRHRMLNFALGVIKEDQDLNNKLQASTEKVTKLIQTELDKKFPSTDMEVLEKYKCLVEVPGLLIKTEESSSNVEKFYNKNKLFKVPKTTEYQNVYWLGAKVGKAVVEWDNLKDDITEAKYTIERDMTQLLAVCNTFEDAVERWPKFEELRSEICFRSSALSTLDQTTLSRINSYKV